MHYWCDRKHGQTDRIGHMTLWCVLVSRGSSGGICGQIHPAWCEIERIRITEPVHMCSGKYYHATMDGKVHAEPKAIFLLIDDMWHGSRFQLVTWRCQVIHQGLQECFGAIIHITERERMSVYNFVC
jgi:hypothetical protein